MQELLSGPGAGYPAHATYSGAALANYFVGRARGGSLGGYGRSLDAAELTLLVYIAHGVALAVHDGPLLDEPVLAADEFVVIPSLFFGARGKPVTAPLRVYDAERGGFVVAAPPPASDRAAKAVLASVWDRYSRASAGQMAADASGAWARFKAAPGFQPGAAIPDDLTEQHFAGLVAEVLV